MAAFVEALPDRGSGRFWIVATPGSLGLVEPCAKLFRPRAEVAVVANGLEIGEREDLAGRLGGTPIFALPTVGLAPWRHGTVLTLLFHAVRGSFGIVDADCFVTDPALHAPRDPAPHELVLGVDLDGFVTRHPGTGLVFPRTHYLWCNSGVVRALMDRHAVTCEKYRRAPRRLRDSLASLGLGGSTFPTPHLPFYDTLQLVLALGLAEGLRIGFLPASSDSLSHFGGATRQVRRRREGRPSANVV